jgi:hypothetical protein
MPIKEEILGRSLSSVRKSAVQIGIAATIKEATPMGTTFSANDIVPNPAASISVPKKTALNNSLRVNRSECHPLRRPIKRNNTKLAARNLNDIDNSGGMVSIVNAIPM